MRRVPRTILVAVALGAAIVGMSAKTHAQVRRLGPEFQANTYTTSSQESPAVATRGDDEFIVLWGGFNPVQTQLFGIRAQRFRRSGEMLGSEFLVSTQATTDDSADMRPAIAARRDGSFVVAWMSYYSGDSADVLVQRFDVASHSVGDQSVVNTGPDEHVLPAVATDEVGRFVVAWTYFGTMQSYRAVTRVRSFREDGTPVGPDVAIATRTGLSPSVRVAMRPDSGEAMVVWFQSGGDSGGFGIVGRRIDPTGALTGSEFQVNTYTTSNQGRPDIAAQGDGFVVVWHSVEEDGDGLGIFGQRLAIDGARVGTEFQVNQYTTAQQALPAVAADEQGNFAVVWESYPTSSVGPLGQDGDGRGIFGRVFDHEGKALGSEFLVNTYTTGDQGHSRGPESDVSMFADGDFVVVWSSPDQDGFASGIFGQRFHVDPTLGPLCLDAAKNDLRVTILDALQVLRAAVGIGSCELCICDADDSGHVAASDALLALFLALGLSPALSCPACG